MLLHGIATVILYSIVCTIVTHVITLVAYAMYSLRTPKIEKSSVENLCQDSILKRKIALNQPYTPVDFIKDVRYRAIISKDPLRFAKIYTSLRLLSLVNPWFFISFVIFRFKKIYNFYTDKDDWNDITLPVWTFQNKIREWADFINCYSIRSADVRAFAVTYKISKRYFLGKDASFSLVMQFKNFTKRYAASFCARLIGFNPKVFQQALDIFLINPQHVGGLAYAMERSPAFETSIFSPNYAYKYYRIYKNDDGEIMFNPHTSDFVQINKRYMLTAGDKAKRQIIKVTEQNMFSLIIKSTNLKQKCKVHHGLVTLDYDANSEINNVAHASSRPNYFTKKNIKFIVYYNNGEYNYIAWNTLHTKRNIGLPTDWEELNKKNRFVKNLIYEERNKDDISKLRTRALIIRCALGAVRTKDEVDPKILIEYVDNENRSRYLELDSYQREGSLYGKMLNMKPNESAASLLIKLDKARSASFANLFLDYQKRWMTESLVFFKNNEKAINGDWMKFNGLNTRNFSLNKDLLKSYSRFEKNYINKYNINYAQIDPLYHCITNPLLVDEEDIEQADNDSGGDGGCN